ncbi:hypothetical protein [Tateyamaria sp. syn59]|uniref:hypothetical protein n=1 Tax=Tateyamaria sp. syn59 TaxID=2576942 RepID=UPI0011BD5976|nr:hypothetical protein [Tateyamaria sp. syn59]
MTIALAATSSAAAADYNAVVEAAQSFLGSQAATNMMTGSLQDLETELSLQPVAQTGLNAANLIILEDSIVDQANQLAKGHQTVENRIVLSDPGHNETVEQLGQNIANYVVASTIGSVSQYFGPGASQEIVNAASLESRSSAVSQGGTNYANVAIAQLSIGTALQEIPDGGTQTVRNDLSLGATARIDAVSQDGTNMGNILIAETIKDVTRSFYGDQVVENHLTVESTGHLPDSITQNGLNVANYVSAISIENMTQTSEGRQVVTNEVVLSGAGPLDVASLDSYGVNYNVGHTNVVNLVEIRAPKDSDAPSVISFSQNSTMSQKQTLGRGAALIGNTATIQR